ncbi:MAG: N-6 DNA methylase [Dehalococcoidales bacterium]|nr:N-6 DNA methylase [Dehalococcoidales bacterium]
MYLIGLWDDSKYDFCYQSLMRETKMPLTSERLHEIVSELATRPQHEKVRSLIYELLVDGLGAKSTEIDFERRVPEVRGRIDALLGRTLFEFKSDLRREQHDAESKLPDYLSQREKETGLHFIGIATDGAIFIPYELHDQKLQRYEPFDIPVDRPRQLLVWLSSVVAVSSELVPSAEIVERELGRRSLAWNVARQELTSIWNEVNQHPDVRLKRDLWSQLIRRVYGTAINEDSLFFQHTYLTVIAKTMAAKVLGVAVTDPGELLSGKRFQEVGIGGAVESDFFDWILASDNGPGLVRRIALQASRFKLEDVQTDVLKGLYESLIDPEQRHVLGEYYTPDWLAQKVCAEAIKSPLEERVIDPACGSGTFIFHAVRRLLKASDEAGVPVSEGISKACRQIFGVDVHPVSAQIARVTFLLALGQERLKRRPETLNIPIYMGDSLQWNTHGFLAERDVLIEVPETHELLEFPFEVTCDPGLFDAVIERMLELSKQNAPADGLTAWLERDYRLNDKTINTLARTYDTLHQLNCSGRDHIWGFVARNLVRPVWLSQDSQKADVVIGNPPWLSYRFMDRDMQQRFREECQARGLWAGGKVATHQDLSGYFFVRSVELYLKGNCNIAFVMPYAAMTRQQFEGFRKGIYGTVRGKSYSQIYATVKFISAWILSDQVQPLFPVPSCVLFATSGNAEGTNLPSNVLSASGNLPKRDASITEAETYLTWRSAEWPSISDEEDASPYKDEFKNGATIFPRVLCVVEPSDAGTLGANPKAPIVQSRRTSQEKLPWKKLPSLRDNVEKEFLRPLYLGESIAPYRALGPVMAVIPWDTREQQLFDAETAQKAGYIYLAKWLAKAEKLWQENGQSGITFKQQIDYYGKLTAQFPIAPIRVVYSKAGTLPAATLMLEKEAIMENTLYWIKVDDKPEGYYLIAILNSEVARKKAESLQARGQWGARHFDKVMLQLPIPRFESTHKIHQALVEAAIHAEQVSSSVQLKEEMYFITARQKIRAALQEDGVSQTIDKLVSELLGPIAIA